VSTISTQENGYVNLHQSMLALELAPVAADEAPRS
jgi:hypothetical protein